MAYIARQVGVPASDLGFYEWDGRTVEYHRAHVRKWRNAGDAGCWPCRSVVCTRVKRAQPTFSGLLSSGSGPGCCGGLPASMICSLTCLGAGAGLRTRLEVILEPSGAARFPVARFLSARGHAVYRVSSAKAAELRQFYRRHAKSNGIDAEALARLPLAAPDGPIELELAAAVLDRRVRACDRLTQQAARRKTRIKDLVRQLMPMTPLTGEVGRADLAVLERYADPGALLAAGPAQLTALISGASRGHQGQVRASPGRPARPEESIGPHLGGSWQPAIAGRPSPPGNDRR